VRRSPRDRDKGGDNILGDAHGDVAHASSRGGHRRPDGGRLGGVDTTCHKQAGDHRHDRVDVGHGPGAGGEENGPGRRADEGLDHIIDMIHGRRLVGEELDQSQDHQGPDHPPARQGIPGRAEREPCREPPKQGDDQERDVGIQACTRGQAEGRQNSAGGIPHAPPREKPAHVPVRVRRAASSRPICRIAKPRPTASGTAKSANEPARFSRRSRSRATTP
jgi:hypothetical protein